MKPVFSELRSLTIKVSRKFPGYFKFYSREEGKTGGFCFLPAFPSFGQSNQNYRLIPTACLLFFIFLSDTSCSDKKKEIVQELKIAKTVPTIYIDARDSGFVKHQDTIYYQDKYFTGFQFSLYPNGDTEFIRSYFNGVEEGLQKKWYPNKQLAEERFYINGKKEGIHQGWWPDGKQKFMFAVNNDEYNGEFKEWYSSGLLGKMFHYNDGHEDGSERLWWDNGTVRANYVIKKGRKYGLIGLKTCVNPYDSILKK